MLYLFNYLLNSCHFAEFYRKCKLVCQYVPLSTSTRDSMYVYIKLNNKRKEATA